MPRKQRLARSAHHLCAAASHCGRYSYARTHTNRHVPAQLGVLLWGPCALVARDGVRALPLARRRRGSALGSVGAADASARRHLLLAAAVCALEVTCTTKDLTRSAPRALLMALGVRARLSGQELAPFLVVVLLLRVQQRCGSARPFYDCRVPRHEGADAAIRGARPVRRPILLSERRGCADRGESERTAEQSAPK